jgi:hypothetical protein
MTSRAVRPVDDAGTWTSKEHPVPPEGFSLQPRGFSRTLLEMIGAHYVPLRPVAERHARFSNR